MMRCMGRHSVWNCRLNGLSLQQQLNIFLKVLFHNTLRLRFNTNENERLRYAMKMVAHELSTNRVLEPCLEEQHPERRAQLCVTCCPLPRINNTLLWAPPAPDYIGAHRTCSAFQIVTATLPLSLYVVRSLLQTGIRYEIDTRTNCGGARHKYRPTHYPHK